MKSSEIREVFLRYFEKNGHSRQPSSSLVPVNDPTLFFTNAGMVQFKDVFLGLEKRPYKRATTSQKCMRVSGKHNDLEQVGLTPRHHTFFEMLGNFSFGDYFKKEAVAYGWEFITKTMGIPKDRLYVTIFEDDDEAEKLWKKHIGGERIFRFGEKDNFWAMGETGPCGPCSEIHFDRAPGAPVKKADFEDGRLTELWNLVFMQFERSANGKTVKLAKPSIDTGLGLERLAAVVQGVEGNYETDLFTPIIEEIEKITGKRYSGRYETGVVGEGLRPLPGRAAAEGRPYGLRTSNFSIRVIADHIRASTFLVADGVMPSNEGRGYVLRRIIRRAIRHGKLIGQERPFFAPIAHIVINEMGGAYPELIQHRAFIEKVLSREEERFYQTLGNGLKILDEAFATLAKKGEKILPGDLAFKLYDTYGFPKDLTVDIAAERGLTVDDAGFERLMTGQREKARAAWKGSGEEKVDDTYKGLVAKGVKTKFVGYEREVAEGMVLVIVDKPLMVSLSNHELSSPRPSTGSGRANRAIHFITDITPFYGESGGQVGDEGTAVGDGVAVSIKGSKKPLPDLIVHEGVIEKGTIKVGDRLTLAVDSERRAAIKRNHTATHLLHRALREALGEHVKQSGSYVGPDRLRFDFSHFQALSDEEVTEIEQEVNAVIRRNPSVRVLELSYNDAVGRGALAFFGEKYGDMVRMVEVEGYSTELCGGTHVSRTGDIGMIKILSESSVAAGVRRIEAVTGRGVEEYLARLEDQQEDLARTLKVGTSEVSARVVKLLERIKQLECQSEGSMVREAKDVEIREKNGIKFITARVDVLNPSALRSLADQYKQKIGSGVVVLGAVVNDKVSIIISVTKDLSAKFDAGEMMKKLATIVGGTGGGRPDMAQGGGPDVTRLDEALKNVEDLISHSW